MWTSAFRIYVGARRIKTLTSALIERSKDLLTDTRLSVLDVGLEVEFRNQQHFATRWAHCDHEPLEVFMFGPAEKRAINSPPIQEWSYRRTVPHPPTIPQHAATRMCRSIRPMLLSATVCSNSPVFLRRILHFPNSARQSIHRCTQ